MSKAGLLPRRWRETPESAAHAEAIAHILDTAPLTTRSDGLVYVAQLATADVLPFLVAAKSLWRQLGRGRFVIVGDRFLTGADRTILAHHLDDPEFAAAAPHMFPAGLPWSAIATGLSRRRGEYWLALCPGLVASGALPEVASAIAANRSLACGHSAGALLGFAAGGPGPLDPARFMTALGEDTSAMAQQDCLMRREADPVILSHKANLVHFPAALRFGDECSKASCAAIAALG